MIPLVNDTISKKDVDELIKWLSTYPRLTKGPLTLEYEKKWSKWLGCKYSVFVNSGSSANLLMIYALIAMGKLKNRNIVVPGLSWATDLSPIMQFNLHPILCDVDLKTLSVDLNKLEEIFERNHPAALLLVSILGFAPDIIKVRELCEKYDVILLEDNCESLGTSIEINEEVFAADGSHNMIRQIKLGNFGLMSSFSTYFGHHISTIEGGMICTNDKKVYDMLLQLRSHGWDRDLDKEKQEELRAKFEVNDFNSLYTFYENGFNVRSTDLQAFIGLGQLDKIDEISRKRNENFLYFQEHLQNDFWKPEPVNGSFTSNFCYPIIHVKKAEIVEALQDAKVEVRPLVCGSMGRQPFYTKRYGKQPLEVCDVIDEYGLYIPNHPSLTKDELDLMITIINIVMKP